MNDYEGHTRVRDRVKERLKMRERECVWEREQGWYRERDSGMKCAKLSMWSVERVLKRQTSLSPV